MQNDIRSYNQAIINSETAMLLDNIGRLSEHQPPHFMMLASVSQTRTFSAASGFQWTQGFAALNPVTAITRTLRGTTIVTTSPSIGEEGAWQVPFATSVNENPTIAFIPIQGQEFFNRFETPMADRIKFLLQEHSFGERIKELNDGAINLIELSAESLSLSHGDGTGDDLNCQEGFYQNYVFLPEVEQLQQQQKEIYKDSIERLHNNKAISLERLQQHDIQYIKGLKRDKIISLEQAQSLMQNIPNVHDISKFSQCLAGRGKTSISHLRTVR